MGLNREQREIAGKVFQVTQMGSKRGLALIPIVTKALGDFLGGMEGGSLERMLKQDVSKLGLAVSRLAASLDDGRFERLVNGMLVGVVVIDDSDGTPKKTPCGNPDQLDRVIEGDWGAFSQLFVFMLKVHFGSFLGENGIASLSGLLPGQDQKAEEPPSGSGSTYRVTSSGGFGGSSQAPT